MDGAGDKTTTDDDALVSRFEACNRPGKTFQVESTCNRTESECLWVLIWTCSLDVDALGGSKQGLRLELCHFVALNIPAAFRSGTQKVERPAICAQIIEHSIT